MALPETIHVKLSSEEAGAVSITPVVAREMLLKELIELMLDLTGKDAARIRELLLRGSLVHGASRYRWSGWDADMASLAALLSSFPDPDPQLEFAPGRCVHIVLEGPGFRIDVAREALARKRLLGRRSFWDALMEVVAGGGLTYAGYSYRERADQFRLRLLPVQQERLRDSAGLLCYSTLESQVRRDSLKELEFFVLRGSE